MQVLNTMKMILVHRRVRNCRVLALGMLSFFGRFVWILCGMAGISTFIANSTNCSISKADAILAVSSFIFNVIFDSSVE